MAPNEKWRYWKNIRTLKCEKKIDNFVREIGTRWILFTRLLQMTEKTVSTFECPHPGPLVEKTHPDLAVEAAFYQFWWSASSECTRGTWINAARVIKERKQAQERKNVQRWDRRGLLMDTYTFVYISFHFRNLQPFPELPHVPTSSFALLIFFDQADRWAGRGDTSWCDFFFQWRIASRGTNRRNHSVHRTRNTFSHRICIRYFFVRGNYRRRIMFIN